VSDVTENAICNKRKNLLQLARGKMRFARAEPSSAAHFRGIWYRVFPLASALLRHSPFGSAGQHQTTRSRPSNLRDEHNFRRGRLSDALSTKDNFQAALASRKAHVPQFPHYEQDHFSISEV